MRLLADENFHGLLVNWLRERGHDVAWIAQVSPAANDPSVASRATAEARVILTNDHDFGRLVFAEGHRPPGVVLLRMPIMPSAQLREVFARQWMQMESNLIGNFTVVTPEGYRHTPIPTSG